MCLDAEQKKSELMDRNEQDGPAFKIEHDPRVTPLGRWLRKSCIDELPQLWNVLRGDMTLVGPRPLPPDETAQCQQWEQRRLDVTPGMTCIWQAEGRRVSFPDWMRMDIRYMQNRSLRQDVILLWKTFLKVICHRASH
jgi:lipopolysaccharide/colanic/teichoic acid biosynthesis glycosyltransferase